MGALAACSEYGADIDAVKAAQTADMRNEDVVARLAGAEGSIEWSARAWEPYPPNSGIILVEATVDKVTRAGEQRRVVLQYVYNRGTEKAFLHDVLVDGQSQGALSGALRMLLMRLE
jgi:hypothetical protein